MTERDFKILKKIAKNQRELSSYAREFQIASVSDISKLHPTIRRGIVGFISDLFELTKSLSIPAKTQLPLNQLVVKQFRNTSTHQYGIITDSMVHTCLMHCTDKNIINAVNELVENYK